MIIIWQISGIEISSKKVDEMFKLRKTTKVCHYTRLFSQVFRDAYRLSIANSYRFLFNTLFTSVVR